MKVIDKVRETDDEKQEMVLTVEATAAEIDETIKAFFAELNEREHEGFRKGHAPRPVLEQSVGGKAKAMGGVAEKIINEKAWEAIDDVDVVFLSEPEFNVDVQPEDHKPFRFTVSGMVKPEMELSNYDPVAVEMPPEQATDAEVEQLISNLREYYYTLELTDEPAAMGDMVNVEMSLLECGSPVRGFSNAKRMIEMGAPTMPHEFTDALLGCTAGQQYTFTFDASAEEGYAHLGSGEVTAEVEVVDVRKKILPPIDDELAGKAGCTNVDDLYKSMRYNINSEKAKQLPKVLEDRCIEAAATRLTEEIPDYYLTFVRGRVQNEVMDKLQKDGTNLQDFLMNQGVDGQKFQDDIRQQAIDRATKDLTLDAIFRAKCEAVTDEDVRKQFSQSEDLEETLKAWEEAGHFSNLREVSARDKAIQWLVATAEVTVVE